MIRKGNAMRGKRTWLILVVIVPLLTGCWSRTEVNDIAIVLGVALDKAENDQFELALQIAVPKGLGTGGSGQGAGSQEPTMMVSAKGASIMEVYRIIQEKLPREVFFAHSRVIIIGEELARDGVSPVLDFFSRHRQSHLRNYLLFTKGKAINILKSNPRLESIMAEEIREQEKVGVGVQTQVRDFLKRMQTDGEEPVAAQISILPLVEGEDSGTSKNVPAVNGAAVFQGDELVGWMNDKEARGILWLRNELKSGTMDVTLSKEKGGGQIGAQIVKGSTKIKPILHNDKIKIKIKVYGEVEVFENTTTLDLSDPEIINTVHSEFEKDVKMRIQLTLDKAQKELNSDIFGFGQAVYRTSPKKWENFYKKRWPEVFPELEVEIVPHITIKGTGFSTKSMSLPDSKN
jgi:spore germination protein KC